MAGHHETRVGAIARIGAVDIAWESFGDPDHPAILLIAGLGTQMIRWTVPFCRALAARGWRVIRFDNRDTGCSSHLDHYPPPDMGALIRALGAGQRPDLPYTLEDMANDAVGLLDALGIGRAHVVGRSMGGMIAQILASEYGHRVRSLTSIMSGTGNPTVAGPAPDVLGLLLGPAPDPAIDPEGFLAHGLAFARRIAGTGQPFDPATHRALMLDELRRGRAPGGTARQLAAMIAAGDRRSRLAGITAPSLVIHGTDDPLIPPAAGHDTAAAIPGAILLEIEGLGHDLPPWVHGRVVAAIHRVAVIGEG
ncbi:alpha/beta hydrolase (plasmid) [Tistrella mobilis]|uniref:alpha/beta fold hydrolase n=1 Tax=Tistrella mobilis TaxID=171437 RepID=UPI003555C4D8